VEISDRLDWARGNRADRIKRREVEEAADKEARDCAPKALDIEGSRSFKTGQFQGWIKGTI
jgi:hypothetical protein